jgi:hypothetical protein
VTPNSPFPVSAKVHSKLSPLAFDLMPLFVLWHYYSPFRGRVGEKEMMGKGTATSRGTQAIAPLRQPPLKSTISWQQNRSLDAFDTFVDPCDGSSLVVDVGLEYSVHAAAFS